MVEKPALRTLQVSQESGEGGLPEGQDAPVGHSLVKAKLGKGLVGHAAVLELGQHELTVTSQERARGWEAVEKKVISTRHPV